MDLDDVLNGQEPEGITAPEAQPEAQAPEPQPTPEPSPPRDESGRFTPKGDEPTPAPPEAAPPAAETPPSHIPVATFIEERRQKQALERQLQELTSRPAQPPPQQFQAPAQPEFIPNPVDDPQGFYDAVMAQAEQRAREALAPQFQQSRIETLRQFAAGRNADFAEVEGEWLKLSQANPALRAEVAQAADPVQAAYDLTKNLLEVRKAGSTDVAAIRAAAVAEYIAAQAAPAAPAAIPTSLADAQSSRALSAGASGPPSLDSILGR